MKINKGFTLIELLVVIAIIGILSSIVISSLNEARKKSRDAERVSEIKQIQTALRMYYSDNGRYPASGGATAPNSAWSNSNNATSWGNLATLLSPYISELPKDPTNTISGWAYSTGVYTYTYLSNPITGCSPGAGYVLVYRPEVMQVPSPGIINCSGGTTNYLNGSVTIGQTPRQ